MSIGLEIDLDDEISEEEFRENTLTLTYDEVVYLRLLFSDFYINDKMENDSWHCHKSADTLREKVANVDLYLYNKVPFNEPEHNETH